MHERWYIERYIYIVKKADIPIITLYKINTYLHLVNYLNL